jgi:aminoglycoside phosphotransferase (APT) family kinase protein
MTDPAVLAVAGQFATRFAPVDAEPVTNGHIHDTYIVTCRPGTDRPVNAAVGMTERIVLQRLNGDVFADLDALMSNLERITGHLRRVAAARAMPPIVADLVATRSGGPTHVAGGATWRASRFVEGARVLGCDATTDDLRAAARAFAELTRDLEDLGPGALADTIPRFHDLARRRADLVAAVARDRAGRATGATDLIDGANRVGDVLERLLAAAGVSQLPNRVVHNDAKLDNVLVDSSTGEVACIVDLDTVMGGTVLNDFGELARTAACRAAEDEPDVTKIQLDRQRFAALADGYVTGAGSFLVAEERDCLALAGPLLTLENAVRFLTDHLDGDVYFRVHRPGHNAQRARAQLRLAGVMLEQLDVLRDTITELSAKP